MDRLNPFVLVLSIISRSLYTKSEECERTSEKITSNSSSIKIKLCFLSRARLPVILDSILSTALLVPSYDFTGVQSRFSRIRFAHPKFVLAFLRFTKRYELSDKVSHTNLTTVDFPVPLLPYTEIKGEEKLFSDT